MSFTGPFPALAGKVDDRDQQIAALQTANRDLSEALRSARTEAAAIRQEHHRIVGRLKNALRPQYDALRALFDDLDAIEGPESPGAQPAGVPNKKAQWEAVKERMEPRRRAAVDILLLQGTMTRKQIAAALQMGYNNCTNNVIGPLIRQGWIVDSGGQLSLKEL